MKIILDENEVNVLESLQRSNMPGFEVVKKIFKLNMEDLESIENIDPKGNVGLQTCSRQEALKTLKEIYEKVFGTQPRVSSPTGEKKKVGPYQ